MSYLSETIQMETIPLSDKQQIIIMMGYPGSGKSTIAKNICKNERFIYIEGDKNPCFLDKIFFLM